MRAVQSIVWFYHLLMMGTVLANQTGTLVLSTEPQTVTLYVNGLLRSNMTPVDLELPVGTHQVEIRATGKKTEQFTVNVQADAVLFKEMVLEDEVPVIQSSEQELSILKLLNPLQGYFEDTREFELRREQLLNSFNQKVRERNTMYQAGTAHLLKENYEASTGSLPIQIAWFNWAQRFELPKKSSIAVLPGEAEKLWKTSLEQPVYLYFESVKKRAAVKQAVVTNDEKKEWIMAEIAGFLSIGGVKDTVDLLAGWVETYRQLYPQVHFKVSMLDAGLGNTGWDGEEQQLNLMVLAGAHPTLLTNQSQRPKISLKVAIEALGVYVHASNPVSELTQLQLDAIFSVSRRCGGKVEIAHWGDLKLEKNIWTLLGEKVGWLPALDLAYWQQQEIQLLIEKDSLALFAEWGLCQGQFKDGLQVFDNQEDLLVALQEFPYAIAVSHFSSEVTGAKLLMLENPRASLLVGGLSGWVVASEENIMAGEYPLARFFTVYLNHSRSSLPTVVNEFAKLLLSQKGQTVVKKWGLVPLSRELLQEEFAKLP